MHKKGLFSRLNRARGGLESLLARIIHNLLPYDSKAYLTNPPKQSGIIAFCEGNK